MSKKIEREIERLIRKLPQREIEDTLRFLKTMLAQRKAGMTPIAGEAWLSLSPRRRVSLFKKWATE